MKAVRVTKNGGPDVLKLQDVPDPEPQAGQVVVRVEAAGVNFIDIYQRTGLYKQQTPFTLGQEGAGRIVALGSGVSGLAIGDRVAWAGPAGSYAELVAIPADRVVAMPRSITSVQAAAAMLQGMTAHYLTSSTFPLTHQHTCLVHAAAGGVGQLLVQMAELRGARVIATAGSDEKCALARKAGADEAVNYREHDVAQFVRLRTKGHGVDVVYDGVGKATWELSMQCLKPRGMLVLFGNASGAVPAIDPLTLSARGSLFLTRPRLADYTVGGELQRRASDVFTWMEAKTLDVHIHREYPLAEAAQAHRDLESRSTTGKLVLVI